MVQFIKSKQTTFVNKPVGINRIDTGAQQLGNSIAEFGKTLQNIAWTEAKRDAIASDIEQAKTLPILDANNNFKFEKGNFTKVGQAKAQEILEARYANKLMNLAKSKFATLHSAYPLDKEGFDNAAKDYIKGHVDSFKKNEMTPTLFAKEVKKVMRDHGLVFGDTFADPGGLGRAILEDYRFHHDLNLQDATKTGKGAAIEIFDEMLQTGRFLVYHTNYEVIKELAELEKDPKKPDQPLDGQEDHLFDAITYAVRATNAFQYFKADPVSEEDEMHSFVIQQDLERQRRSQEIINNDIDNFDDVIVW